MEILDSAAYRVSIICEYHCVCICVYVCVYERV